MLQGGRIELRWKWSAREVDMAIHCSCETCNSVHRDVEFNCPCFSMPTFTMKLSWNENSGDAPSGTAKKSKSVGVGAGVDTGTDGRGNQIGNRLLSSRGGRMPRFDIPHGMLTANNTVCRQSWRGINTITIWRFHGIHATCTLPSPASSSGSNDGF